MPGVEPHLATAEHPTMLADYAPVLAQLDPLGIAAPTTTQAQSYIGTFDGRPQAPAIGADPYRVPKCSLSKYGFRASWMRTTTSTDRAKTGL